MSDHSYLLEHFQEMQELLNSITLPEKRSNKVSKVSQKIGAWILERKARFFLLCGVLAAIIILILDFRRGFDWNGILVESHGMLFDIILFGILLAIYETLIEKKNKIRQYTEEIDDFSGWDEKEAVYRITGNIKRLNRIGISEIELIGAYLHGAKLEGANLKGANLQMADLQKAKLSNTELEKANLELANLQGAQLMGANLQRADISFAQLQKASLAGTQMQGTNLFLSDLKEVILNKANLQAALLMATDLQGANLAGANLQGALLLGANLAGANLQGALLKGAYIEKVKAYISQKEDFSEIMTKEQISSIIWLDNETQELIKNSIQCTTKKKNGEPCTRKAKTGYNKCTQHLKLAGELP